MDNGASSYLRYLGGDDEAFENIIETYINMIDRNTKNLPYILPECPQLIEIDYTEREELLYPQIRYESNSTQTETVVENGKKINEIVNKQLIFRWFYEQ